MQTSEAGRKFIEQWEGRYTHTYDDGVGVLTIGYGHTTAAGPPVVKKGMVISIAECDEILARDLAKVERDVNRLVKVPLTQAQFDTLVSFQFNTGKLGSSTLLKKLNAGDYAAVPAELMKWNKGGGKVMKGLTRRRKAEGEQWGTDIPAPTPAKPASATIIKSARTVGAAVGGTAATAQVVSSVVGPVNQTVEQVQVVTDTAGQVVDVSKQVVHIAPEGFWLHTLAFMRSPLFLAIVIVVILAAWGLSWWMRRHEVKA